jgi:hypothetical protein
VYTWCWSSLSRCLYGIRWLFTIVLYAYPLSHSSFVLSRPRLYYTSTYSFQKSLPVKAQSLPVVSYEYSTDTDTRTVFLYVRVLYRYNSTKCRIYRTTRTSYNFFGKMAEASDDQGVSIHHLADYRPYCTNTVLYGTVRYCTSHFDPNSSDKGLLGFNMYITTDTVKHSASASMTPTYMTCTGRKTYSVRPSTSYTDERAFVSYN